MTFQVKVIRGVSLAAAPYENGEMPLIFDDCRCAPYILDDWLHIEQKDGRLVTKIPTHEILRYSSEYIIEDGESK